MAPKRLQRLLLRLLVYDVILTYRCGRQMQLADTLSRAYLPLTDATPFEMEVQSVNMVQDLPLAPARLDDVQAHTAKDDTLQVLTRVILEGSPEDKTAIPAAAMPYFSVRDELSVQNGIILRGERALIPKSLRHDMLRRIHMPHMGVEGCLRRARECVYWPAMSSEVKDFIVKCDICRSVDNKQQKETLISHDVPDRPWAKVGVHVQPDQLPDNRGLLLWVLGDRPSRKHYSQSHNQKDEDAVCRRTKTLLPTTKNLLVPEVTMGQHQKILANKQNTTTKQLMISPR